MNRTRLFALVGFVLLCLLGYFSFHSIQNYSHIVDSNKSLGRRILFKDRTIACLKQNYIYNNRYISDSLPPIFDLEGLSYSINMLSENDSVFLICKISDSYCSSCNDYAINIARECCYKNTIFIANSSNQRILRNLSLTYNIDQTTLYGTVSKLSDADFLLFPYFLFVDKDNTINSIYIPFEANDDSDKEMLKLMLDMLNKS